MSQKKDANPKNVTGGLTLHELGRRTWKSFNQDNGPDKAAGLAFYFTLAFFPLLIFLITLLGFIPGADDLIFGYLDTMIPPEAQGIIHRWGTTIFRHHNSELLSFSLLVTLWSASTGVAGLIDVFNVAYGIKEGRSYWKYRLVALLLTLGLALLVFGGALLVTSGTFAVHWLAQALHLRGYITGTIDAINAMIGLMMLFFGISILHYFGPNAAQRWNFFTPGAVLTVVGILGVSYLFAFYLHFAPSYSAVYGSLGAIIIFMLWLYLVGIMLIIGAEVNSEIQKAAGKHLRVRVEPREEQ